MLPLHHLGAVRSFLAILLAGLVAGSSLLGADIDPAALKKAQGIYEEVNGKEENQVKASKRPGDRSAFAKKLYDSTKAVTDPALQEVLLQKALLYSKSDLTGWRLAQDIYRPWLDDPRRGESLEGYIEVLEKLLTAEPVAGKPRMAMDIANLSRELSTEKNRRGDSTGALAALTRAEQICRVVKTPDATKMLGEMEADAKLLRAQVALDKDIDRAKGSLKSNPKDPKLNEKVGLAYLRANRPQLAAPHLALSPDDSLRQLGIMLGRTPPPPAPEMRDVLLAADRAVEGVEEKRVLLGLARKTFEGPPVGSAITRLESYIDVLERLLPLETAAAKPRLAFDLVGSYREMATLKAAAGEMAVAVTVSEKAEQVCKTARVPETTKLLPEVEAVVKHYKSLEALTRDADQLQLRLKMNPDDPKLNEDLALTYLRLGKMKQAVPHLRALPAGPMQQLGKQLEESPPDLMATGDLLRQVADGVEAAAEVKDGLRRLARRQYEILLENSPQHPNASKIQLLIATLPVPVREGPVLKYIDLLKDRDKLVTQLNMGANPATASIDKTDGFSPAGCLKVAAGRAVNKTITGWEYRIVENPRGEKEIRYLCFAWKSTEKGTATFRLATTKDFLSLYAGPNPNPPPAHVWVGDKVPADWTFVVRDLYKDFGSGAVITGLQIDCDVEAVMKIDLLALSNKLDVLKGLAPPKK